MSIILNKKFFRLSKIENGVQKKDDRIDSILEITGLNNRTITDFDDFLKIVNSEPIWEKVEKN